MASDGARTNQTGVGKFLAFDVGCIECGEASAVLGVFETREEAQTVCDQWEATGWRGGQHYYEVFDLSEPAAVLPDETHADV